MNNTEEYTPSSEFDQDPDNTSAIWKRHPTASFIVTIILALLVATCIIAIFFIVSTDHPGIFSEFYILGQEGKAEGYPRDIILGDDVKATLGIVNHENSRQVYTVDILISGVVIDSIGPVTLENNEKWENNITFKPVTTGDNQKVEFTLSRQFQLAKEPNKPLSLQMFLNVQ